LEAHDLMSLFVPDVVQPHRGRHVEQRRVGTAAEATPVDAAFPARNPLPRKRRTRANSISGAVIRGRRRTAPSRRASGAGGWSKKGRSV
jgi:hypothetical protein